MNSLLRFIGFIVAGDINAVSVGSMVFSLSRLMTSCHICDLTSN
jgi:hypothetical protein